MFEHLPYHRTKYVTAAHWSEIDRNDTSKWPWKYFPPEEVACKGTGRVAVHRATMDRLMYLRSQAGAKPIVLNSAYRDPAHNAAVSSTGTDGPHTFGQAFDIQCSHERAYQLVGLAIRLGFTGIGLSQKGAWGGRFLHLDDLPNGPGQPRPTVWTY